MWLYFHWYWLLPLLQQRWPTALQPFLPLSSHALHALELVHTDLSGPAHAPGTGGVIYHLTITDTVNDQARE